MVGCFSTCQRWNGCYYSKEVWREVIFEMTMITNYLIYSGGLSYIFGRTGSLGPLILNGNFHFPYIMDLTYQNLHPLVSLSPKYTSPGQTADFIPLAIKSPTSPSTGGIFPYVMDVKPAPPKIFWISPSSKPCLCTTR